MKKTFAVLSAALLLVSLLFAGCTTEPVTDDPYADIPETPAQMFEYERAEDGGIAITRYIGTDEHVIIPHQIDNLNVTEIHAMAFRNINALVSVTFPDTVTKIDDQAFENCESLTTAKLPDTLCTIGQFAFRNCKALKSITIPDSVTDVYMEAFLYSGLESVTLGAGLTRIRENVFGGTNIKEIEIPSNIQVLSYGAFGGCSQLETVILHDGLQQIDSQAFAGESKLKEIMIPKTVTVIDSLAFSGCRSLEKIKLEGDAPAEFASTTATGPINVHYTVYYHKGATGFDSPEWDSIPTAHW